jgi:hypothetical protein
MLLANLGGSIVAFIIATMLAFLVALFRRFMFVDWPDNVQRARHTTPPPGAADVRFGALGDAADYLTSERKGRLEILFYTILICLLFATLFGNDKITLLTALRHFFHRHMFTATTSWWKVIWAGAWLWSLATFLVFLTASAPRTTSVASRGHGH